MGIFNKKLVTGTICFFTAGGVIACGCPGVNDAVWQAALKAAEASVQGSITAMTQSVSQARTVNLQRVMSAIRVVAKQVEMSGEKQAATEVAAKQAAANFAVELSNRKAILQTGIEYNASTGQGYDPCGELKRSQNVAAAIGEANTAMPERVMREIDAAPGRLASPGEAITRRLTEAKTLYCTADQVKAGICASPGPMAGKDLDAGAFFSTAQAGSAESAAKSALINHMYGLPREAPDKSAVNTPTGKAFFEAKRTEDGFRSISQTSMKTVQAWTESRPGGADGSASVIDSISQKVGTYTGGAEYAEWEKGQTTQSERGLLVELAKMRALELYMRNQEYQQLERQETNIAAMLALRGRVSARANNASTTVSAQAKVQ